MKLVNAVAVVNNFETSDHVACEVGFLLVSHLLADWVLIRGGLSHLNVVVLLGLHSAFKCSDWRVRVKG